MLIGNAVNGQDMGDSLRVNILVRNYAESPMCIEAGKDMCCHH